MPSKKADKDEKGNKADSKLHKTNNCAKTCGTKGPGPKYELKPVVGYVDHCQSKYREPAYTIGKILRSHKPCQGPGPKYLYKLPGISGYTIPKATNKQAKACTPGPQYTLPGFWAPAYSIVPKPKNKCSPPTSGPYDPPQLPPGPCFPFAGKPKDRPCQFSPPIRDIGAVTLLKPNSPAFTIVGKATLKTPCRSPGPKYDPGPLSKGPAFSLRIKHTECSTLPRTECDELC